MELRDAVLAYDAAIQACANDPTKMSTFCSAEGDDLDDLYAAMLEAARPEAVDVEPSLFVQMENGYFAHAKAEQAIEDILGVGLLGINFDYYDGSFEIYPESEVLDVATTPEQHAAIVALGCQRYWINFPDGTERYCRGDRKPAPGSNRWNGFNTGGQHDRRAALTTQAPTEPVPHSCAGFLGAFESDHQRKPTPQEVWNAAIRSWRDLSLVWPVAGEPK